MLDGMKSFIFGGNTDAPTYDVLKKRRDIADLIAQRSMSSTPKNLGEGLASIGNALAYRYMDNKLQPREDGERKAITDAIAALGGGGGYSGYSGGPVAGAPGGFTGASAAPAAPVGAPVAPAMASGGNPIYDGLIQRGLPEPVAQGFMMNFADESGMNPGINEQNPMVPGSRGGFGLAQWTGPRRNALEQYASQSGRPVDDANTQLDFLMTELQGPEKGAAAQFMGATDPGQAAAGIATHFLRPAPENLAPRVAEYTGGGGFDMGALSSMMPREPDTGRLSQIADLLGNPYASEGQKAVLGALLKREMDAGGVDPLDLAKFGLDQQRFNLERDKLNRAEDPTFFGNPIWGKDPAGNDVIGQMGSNGEFRQVKLPEGFNAEPGGIKVVNQGTQSGIIDRSGDMVGALPTDNAGRAAAVIAGETAGAAKAGLSEFELQVGQASDLIGRITKNPAMENAFGVINSKLPTFRQDTANLEADVNQLKSQIFPMAIQALKGLGAMSNMEGDAFAQSIASLDFTRDPPAAIAELNRVNGVLQEKLAIAQAKAKAAGGATAAPAPIGIPQSAIDAGIDPALWPYLSPEEQALWSK